MIIIKLIRLMTVSALIACSFGGPYGKKWGLIAGASSRHFIIPRCAGSVGIGINVTLSYILNYIGLAGFAVVRIWIVPNASRNRDIRVIGFRTIYAVGVQGR